MIDTASVHKSLRGALNNFQDWWRGRLVREDENIPLDEGTLTARRQRPIEVKNRP